MALKGESENLGINIVVGPIVITCINFVDFNPGVVILQIENKSAPLRGRKIINLRVMNFQKFPYF